MTVALVGELNPYGADPRYALYHEPRNASGDRLRRILGLTVRSYVPLPKYNLCVGKWSVKAARARAQEIWGQHSTLVLLGGKVRAVYDDLVVGKLEAFKVRTIDASAEWKVLLIPLPHPSGMCREWNNPTAVLGARELVKRYAGLPCGEVEEFFRATVQG